MEKYAWPHVQKAQGHKSASCVCQGVLAARISKGRTPLQIKGQNLPKNCMYYLHRSKICYGCNVFQDFKSYGICSMPTKARRVQKSSRLKADTHSHFFTTAPVGVMPELCVTIF